MKQKRFIGFTLIEVVLVLAIGGLILAMVFIAVPSLMALQRDSERRDDVSLLIMKLNDYQTNNSRGALPTPGPGSGTVEITGSSIVFGPTSGTTWADFYKSFFDDNFVDPSSTEKYNWRIVDCGNSTYGQCSNTVINNIRNGTFKSNNYYMYIIRNATCDGGDAVYTPSNRDVAVLYRLERGDLFCTSTK